MVLQLNRLKAYRTLHNETQIDIANILKISLTSYCLKEQGRREFTASEVGKIAKHWNIPVSDLFSDNPRLR